MAGDDEGFAFVSVIKDLLEVVLLLPVNGLHTEVVDDEDVQFVQSFKQFLVLAFDSCDPDGIHQFLHCVVCHLVALPAGFVAKRTCKERFPRSSCATDEHRGSGFDVFSA